MLSALSLVYEHNFFNMKEIHAQVLREKEAF